MLNLKEYNFGQNIIKDVSLGKSNYGIYNSNILVEYIKRTYSTNIFIFQKISTCSYNKTRYKISKRFNR